MPDKYSVTIRGHRTSYSLEPEFHAQLRAIARRRQLSDARLIAEIDEARTPGQNLSAAIRLFVLDQIMRGPP